MASSSNHSEFLTTRQPLQNTIDLIEVAVLVLTNLLEHFDEHSDDDIYQVVIFLLRHVSDIQFRMMI